MAFLICNTFVTTFVTFVTCLFIVIYTFFKFFITKLQNCCVINKKI